MPHQTSRTPLAAFHLALLLALSTGCDESNIDARSLAEALSEEFTDGIEFEDGTTEEGPPPEETADAPQIMGIDAPISIGPAELGYSGLQPYNTPFPITLQGDQDLEGPGVIGAVAHIRQANKDDASERYIRIEPVPPDIIGNDLTLQAQVNYRRELAGNAFRVRLAFLLDDGRRSAFFPWNLVTHARPGDSIRVPMCSCQQADLRLHDPEAHDQSDCSGGFNFDEEPTCQLWASFAGDVEHDESRPYPSGTFFPPSWLSSAAGAPCIVEFWCR